MKSREVISYAYRGNAMAIATYLGVVESGEHGLGVFFPDVSGWMKALVARIDRAAGNRSALLAEAARERLRELAQA